MIEALEALGLAAVVGVGVYRALPIAFNARSWQLLLPPEGRPRFLTLLRLRWVGESVNTLLPLAQVGGDVARARLLAARGVPRADAAAAMAADLGVGIGTQAIFAAAGALALARVERASAPSRTAELVLGATAAAVAVVLLLALLAAGSARAKRALARGRWAALAGGLERLELALRSLLARRRALALASAWHLAGWVAQVGETFVLLRAMRVPISVEAAFAIESLSSAARGAAFVVPGGVGVQEVTLVSLARLVGVDLGPALALGFAKRARELVVGVPGLLAWAHGERESLRRLGARLGRRGPRGSVAGRAEEPPHV